MAYLASEKCPFNGETFVVQGAAISRLRGWEPVETVETDGPWIAAELEGELSAWA